MQAFFLPKNITAPGVFIKVGISKCKEMLEVREKDCVPLFSSAPDKHVVITFPISSTKNTVAQSSESESRTNLNPLITK